MMTRARAKNLKTKAPVTVDFDRKAIGKRIAAARRHRGWRQRDLADAIGVALGTVVAWECGVRLPERTKVLARLAKALRRKVDWLLLGGATTGGVVVHRSGIRRIMDLWLLNATPTGGWFVSFPTRRRGIVGQGAE